MRKHIQRLECNRPLVGGDERCDFFGTLAGAAILARPRCKRSTIFLHLQKIFVDRDRLDRRARRKRLARDPCARLNAITRRAKRNAVCRDCIATVKRDPMIGF